MRSMVAIKIAKNAGGIAMIQATVVPVDLSIAQVQIQMAIAVRVAHPLGAKT